MRVESFQLFNPARFQLFALKVKVNYSVLMLFLVAATQQSLSKLQHNKVKHSCALTGQKAAPPHQTRI